MSKTITELIGLIGVDETMRVLANFGGSTVYFSKLWHGNSSFPIALNHETLAALACYFGGTGVYIPLCHDQVRDRLIMVDIENGLNAQQVAVKYRVSNRTVFNILKKHRAPTLQQDLFG